jgi:hypothetical protein
MLRHEHITGEEDQQKGRYQLLKMVKKAPRTWSHATRPPSGTSDVEALLAGAGDGVVVVVRRGSWEDCLGRSVRSCFSPEGRE